MKLFSGRINRSSFALSWIISTIFLYSVAKFLKNFYTQYPNSDFTDLFFQFSRYFFGLLIIVFYITIYSKRWHDLGKSAWLTLLAVIPIVNLFVFIYLCFKPGDSKKNKYGDKPVSIHI